MYHYWLAKWRVIIEAYYYASNTVTDSFLVRVPVFSAAMQLHQKKKPDTSGNLAVCNSLVIGNQWLLVWISWKIPGPEDICHFINKTFYLVWISRRCFLLLCHTRQCTETPYIWLDYGTWQEIQSPLISKKLENLYLYPFV